MKYTKVQFGWVLRNIENFILEVLDELPDEKEE